jgi:L-ascorbate metabolism protein UlaG (beta-lactamase superfamily)
MNRLLARASLLSLAACTLLPAAVRAEPCDPRFLQSPRFVAADCSFQNPPNPDLKPQRSGWAIWSRLVLEKKVGTVPEDPIPVRTLDRAALAAMDPSANHIVRLGHSSHLLKLKGKWWLIDPVFGQRASPVSWAGPKRFHPSPLALEDVPQIEGLILSHDHYDHLDVPTIEALKDRVQRYFVPLGVGARLKGFGVAPERIEEFDWWQERQVGDVHLTATPAQHFSGRTLWDRNKTLWASWLIQSGNERIFYSGDTGYFPGFKEIAAKAGAIDIALMENGAYDTYWPTVHMSPEETVQAFQELGAKTLYLVHNSTFDLAFHTWRDPLERVAALAQAKGLALATPEIGEVLTLGKPRENRKWWEGLK